MPTAAERPITLKGLYTFLTVATLTLGCAGWLHSRVVVPSLIIETDTRTDEKIDKVMEGIEKALSGLATKERQDIVLRRQEQIEERLRSVEAKVGS